MSYIYRMALIGLDKLQQKENDDVAKYIESFNNDGGFMFHTEITNERIVIKNKMEELLDDGTHSGASFGCMMRLIQALLSGVITRQDLLKEIEEDDKKMEEFLKEREAGKACSSGESQEAVLPSQTGEAGESDSSSESEEASEPSESGELGELFQTSEA